MVYVDKKELLDEFYKSKQRGRMTDAMGLMLINFVSGMAEKRQFRQYSYRDEFQGNALKLLSEKWEKFNPAYYTEKGMEPNIFGYYYRIIHNSFKRTLVDEKKIQKRRDELAMDHGKAPSYNYESDDI